MNDLVGIPYKRGAQGPEAIDCWALVRLACQRIHGTAPPELYGAVAPVVRGASAQGWKPAESPRPGDILVMRTAKGDRHTGFVLRARNRLEILHAMEGGSVCQPLSDLPLLGFNHIKPWRLT
jgi:cell wall-associated NlpC family hydrolase